MERIFVFLRVMLPWITVGLLYAALFAIRARKKRSETQTADCGAEGMSFGMCLGLCLEVPFGDNSGMGIALGMLIGLAVGTCLRRENHSETNDEA